MNDEYMSMKQIAEKLGVSKQRVYRCVKAHCISEAHHDTVKGNTVLMYDKAAVDRISEFLGISSEAHRETVDDTAESHHDAVNDTVYEALLMQLEIKDQQIKDLNERLAEAHKSLDQEQQLHLLSKQRILELENKNKDEESELVSNSEEDFQVTSWWKKSVQKIKKLFGDDL